jgi:Timeless protein
MSSSRTVVVPLRGQRPAVSSHVEKSKSTHHQPSSKPKTRKPSVTPNPNKVDATLLKRMKVEKKIVDELLVICSVIGTTTLVGESGRPEEELLVPVTDCINWLQDLQRCLRRDDDLYRPISLLFGQWKIVSHKLLPLVLHSRFDSAIVLTVCKILVILTKPLASNTVHAGCMVIDTKSGKVSERYVANDMQCC